MNARALTSEHELTSFSKEQLNTNTQGGLQI